jgi:hypothetical protein
MFSQGLPVNSGKTLMQFKENFPALDTEEFMELCDEFGYIKRNRTRICHVPELIEELKLQSTSITANWEQTIDFVN